MRELRCLDGQVFHVAEPVPFREFCDHIGKLRANCDAGYTCEGCGDRIGDEDVARMRARPEL